MPLVPHMSLPLSKAVGALNDVAEECGGLLVGLDPACVRKSVSATLLAMFTNVATEMRVCTHTHGQTCPVGAFAIWVPCPFGIEW
jgi:hypothetical protein